MNWVLQTNLYDEQGFESLCRAIEMYGSSKAIVKVIPFDGGLEESEGVIPADDSDTIVMGSYTLAKVAKRRNWRPGSFLDNLDFVLQHKQWGDLMLNHDALVVNFEDVPEQINPFFLRPVHDTKAFTGMVIDWPYYKDWSDSVSLIYDRSPGDMVEFNPLTKVMVCSKKEIWTETRFWVVEKRPVTWSQYKTGTIKGYKDPDYTSNELIDFATMVAWQWSPNEAYCLDIAETPAGLKIVEVNNLNSAGLYKGNMFKLVDALEAWAEYPGGLLW